jgi:hypothetical protein
MSGATSVTTSVTFVMPPKTDLSRPEVSLSKFFEYRHSFHRRANFLSTTLDNGTQVFLGENYREKLKLFTEDAIKRVLAEPNGYVIIGDGYPMKGRSVPQQPMHVFGDYGPFECISEPVKIPDGSKLYGSVDLTGCKGDLQIGSDVEFGSLNASGTKLSYIGPRFICKGEVNLQNTSSLISLPGNSYFGELDCRGSGVAEIGEGVGFGAPARFTFEQEPKIAEGKQVRIEAGLDGSDGRPSLTTASFSNKG